MHLEARAHCQRSEGGAYVLTSIRASLFIIYPSRGGIGISILAVAGGFILFDLATGIVKALKKKELKSARMREGLYNKAGFVMVLALGLGIDIAQKYAELGFSVPVLKAVASFICLTEIVSIWENICIICPALNNSVISSYFHINSKEEE